MSLPLNTAGASSPINLTGGAGTSGDVSGATLSGNVYKTNGIKGTTLLLLSMVGLGAWIIYKRK
jgi:hypothetical protein